MYLKVPHDTGHLLRVGRWQLAALAKDLSKLTVLTGVGNVLKVQLNEAVSKSTRKHLGGETKLKTCYSGTCLKRSPSGPQKVAVIKR